MPSPHRAAAASPARSAQPSVATSSRRPPRQRQRHDLEQVARPVRRDGLADDAGGDIVHRPPPTSAAIAGTRDGAAGCSQASSAPRTRSSRRADGAGALPSSARISSP